MEDREINTTTACPGTDCERLCGPGECACKPCACPKCLWRTDRARYGRLAQRPGHPTQLVLVREDPS